MDLLERLVAQILKDLTKAQNQSNELSARLATYYNDPPEGLENLRYFPLPNSHIKSFDFDLKFALEELEAIVNDQFISRLDELVMECWGLLIETLQEENALIFNTIENIGEPPGISKRDLINLFQEANEEFHQLLARYIVLLVSTHLQEKIKPDWNAEPFWRDWEEKLLNQINDKLLDLNLDLQSLASMKAVFDLEKLNELDEKTICNINVKVDMRSYKWGYLKPEKDDNNNITQKSFLNLEAS